MAGLNNLLSDTQQTTTTMPAWYDQAQQNVVSGGNTAAAAAPTFGQTTQQNAVNTLQGANNPFTQAQGTLQQISSGAANPWITDPTTGTVTPNTSTAMGGLFQAQQQELNQLMPNYTAPMQAGAIGSGNFGSLRGQTAVDKAKGDAFAKLNAAQMQAALSNQQTGQQAAAGLGNVGQQGINANMNVGMQQMNAPFQTLGNQASLLGTLQAPTTVSSQKQMSPLTQAATLANTLQGTGVAGGLSSLLFGSPASGTQGQAGYKAPQTGLFGTTGLGAASQQLKNWISGVGGSSGQVPGTYPLQDGGSAVVGNDGTVTITDAGGNVQTFDKGGNPTGSVSPIPDTGLPPDTNPGNPDNPSPITDYTGPAIDNTGADYSDPGYGVGV
jgi:hypothetical protein